MQEITNPRWLLLKLVLFGALGAMAAALILLRTPDASTALLLAVCVWAFARAYYFCFYVIEHYVDRNFRPGAVRPPYFALMNPMRDRTPEQLADRYFSELRAGRVAAASSVFGANREVMLEAELQYPPVSWTVTDRRDERNRAHITYRVRRGGGYEGAEDARFDFLRKPAWTLSSYNAVY